MAEEDLGAFSLGMAGKAKLGQIELFEKQGQFDKSNVHVVFYKRNPNQEGLKYGVDVKRLPITGVAPLSPVRSILYRDISRFANVIVEVPLGSDRANVIVPEREPLQPSSLRYHAGSVLFGIGLVGVFAMRRTRRKVQGRVKTAQANLKHAKELVNLFKYRMQDKMHK